jgi:hypothetical protein
MWAQHESHRQFEGENHLSGWAEPIILGLKYGSNRNPGVRMAAASEFQSKILSRKTTLEEYRIYRAGLEWDLTDPIGIEDAAACGSYS